MNSLTSRLVILQRRKLQPNTGGGFSSGESSTGTTEKDSPMAKASIKHRRTIREWRKHQPNSGEGFADGESFNQTQENDSPPAKASRQ